MTQDELDTNHPLPVGLTEFHEWADTIIKEAGAFADEASMKWALASQVLHLPHDVAFKPRSWFVNCLRKAAANQIASQVFNDIKKAQEEAKIAAEKATAAVMTIINPSAEATAASQEPTADATTQKT